MQNSTSTPSQLEDRKSRTWTDAIETSTPLKRTHDTSDSKDDETEIPSKLCDESVQKSARVEQLETDPAVASSLTSEEQHDRKSEVTQNTADHRSIKDVIQDLVNANSEESMSWTAVFGKIENNEMLNPVLLDQLLDEAKQLEQRLLDQKEKLKQKLGFMSSLLTVDKN